MARIESGRRTDVRSSPLSALASALGITVDYLLGSPPDRSPLAVSGAYREYALDQPATGSPWVSIVGQPMWTDARETRAWTTYESLLNVLFAAWPVTVMCAYDVHALARPIVDSARRTHPMTIAGTTPTPNPEYVEPPTDLFGA